jgi:hypothetical protein
MIGKWLLRMMRNAEKEVYGPSAPDRPNHLSNALYNGQPVVSVFRISNGFVISHSDYHSHQNTLVYCKEVSEIGDQIITLQARAAMGVPPNVTIGASGAISGGMAKVAQQLQYPRS